MENLLDIIVGILGGAGIIFFLRLFRPKPNQKNHQIKIEVEKLDKINQQLKEKELEIINESLQKISNLERKKNEQPKNNEELADFFNNRKSN